MGSPVKYLWISEEFLNGLEDVELQRDYICYGGKPKLPSSSKFLSSP